MSDNYEEAAQKELGPDWPAQDEDDRRSPLAVLYEQNPADGEVFENLMRRKVHYVIKPEYLWSSIAEQARTQSNEMLRTLQQGFRFIENERCQPWRAKRRLVVPSSREAALLTRRAHSARG
nr:type I restriction-modification system subunit M N-terminal domain-containing protein [Thiolapillus sp.]